MGSAWLSAGLTGMPSVPYANERRPDHAAEILAGAVGHVATPRE